MQHGIAMKQQTTDLQSAKPLILTGKLIKMDPPMKVVFAPYVDKFEVLQIKGLFNKFKAS